MRPAGPSLVAGAPATALDRVKQAVRERTGYFEPPIYSGPPQRAERPLRTIMGTGAHYAAEAVSGLGLGIPDIVASKTKGDEGFTESVDRMTGFVPTPKEQAIGEAVEFMGGLRTAGKGVGFVTSKLAARQALKTMLSSGLTFGTRKATEEIADKIVRNDPIDIEGIHFEAGVGVLFGAGEAGVREFARFIKNVRTGKAMVRVPGKAAQAQGRPGGITPEQRAEINEAIRLRNAGQPEAWDRVRNKWGGVPMPGQKQPVAAQPKAVELRVGPGGKLIETPAPAYRPQTAVEVPRGPSQPVSVLAAPAAKAPQGVRPGEQPVAGPVPAGQPVAGGAGPVVQTQPYPAYEGDKRITKQGPAYASREDVELFDQLRQGTIEYNGTRTTKARKAELVEVATGLRRDLARRGYQTDFIKAVEMGDAGIPLPAGQAVEGSDEGIAPRQTLTLYHGTDEKIGPQDLRATAPQYEGSLGEGIYFGQDRQTAEFYGKNVLEVPVRITNPLVIDAAEGTNYRAEPGAEAQRNETGVYDSILPGEQIIPFDVQIGGQWVPIRNAEDLQSLSRRAQATGHDALIVRGIRDNATVNEEVVVFNRNQIVSGDETALAADQPATPPSPVTAAPQYTSEGKPDPLADAAKSRRREVLQAKLQQGERIGDSLLQEFAGEPWVELGPRPLINMKLSALKRDEQLRKQQAWDKKWEKAAPQVTAAPQEPVIDVKLPVADIQAGRKLNLDELRKARETRRRMGGFTSLPVDAARELITVVRAAKDNPVELLRASWQILRRNLRAGTTYMRTLGGGGRLIANDLDDITFQMTKKGNQDLADIRLAYQGLTKQQQKLVAQIMNERVPPAGQSKTVLDRVPRLREILDRTMNEAAALGMSRLVEGEKIPIGGSGKAFPQVPNAVGIAFLKEAKAQGKASARVFAWAQEQVKAGRYANIDEAIGALQDFRDRQLRGINQYLERTRVELPTDMIEWDGAKILPHLIERNWLTIEGVRKWGSDQAGQSFPRVRSRVERIRQEYGSEAAERVSNFISTSFGLQSPASQQARTISNKIRAYQFATKIAASPLTIIRNMTDRLAKGMMHSMVGTIEALAKYPPFVNGFIRASQKIEDEMIRRGAVFSHTALSEAYEAGSVATEMLRTPFMESERGNQVFEAVVAQKALMRDLAILERQRPGTLGRIADKVDYVFGRGKDQAAYRVGPRLMEKLQAGDTITDDDISRFLHEAVSNQAFPMLLNSKPIWWDAHPAMKVLAQFKTWPLRQANMIWEDVFKYTVKTGDLTRLIGFLAGTLVAGEIYNIARDLLFDKNESLAAQAFRPAQDRQIARAIVNDLLDGGVVGVLADFTYGVHEWIGGVQYGTAKNLGELVGNIKKTPGLTLPAIEKFMRQEVTPYRQILAGLNKIDQQIDPKNISAPYMKWRAAAHHWQKTQEHPGILGQVESYTDEVLFGRPEYPIGENTLAYELAARQVMVGDIHDAARFIEYIITHAKEGPIKARTGLKQSMNARSPLGPISDTELPRFLKSLSPDERQKALKTNAAFKSNYVKAIHMAARRSRSKWSVEDTGKAPEPTADPNSRPAIDLAGLRNARQRK